jgi:glucose/arabinose dehydrogenase
MERKSTSLSAFFDLCVLIALVAFLADVFPALFGFGAFSNAFAQAKV